MAGTFILKSISGGPLDPAAFLSVESAAGYGRLGEAVPAWFPRHSPSEASQRDAIGFLVEAFESPVVRRVGGSSVEIEDGAEENPWTGIDGFQRKNLNLLFLRVFQPVICGVGVIQDAVVVEVQDVTGIDVG